MTIPSNQSPFREATFVLSPHVGAIPIRFGMSQAEVASVVGTPERVKQTRLGEQEEQRAGVLVRYSKTGDGVVEITFLPTETLLFNGLNLFQVDPIQALLLSDPAAFEWVGFIVFLSLGVAVTGYHDNDPSQRAITVSKRGRWDAYRERFAPFGT